MSEADRRQNARGAIALWAEALKRRKYWEICTSQQGPVMNRLGRLIERGIDGGEFKTPVDTESPERDWGYVAYANGTLYGSVLNHEHTVSPRYGNIRLRTESVLLFAMDAETLRDRLWEGILAKLPRVRRNGPADAVLPNTLNVEIEGAAGELLLQALDLAGVAVSAGAACASGSVEPSRVLLAMGRSPQQARASLRLSVGHGVDEAAIDHVLALLPDLVARARAAGEA